MKTSQLPVLIEKAAENAAVVLTDVFENPAKH